MDPATGVAIGSIALEIEKGAQNIITRHVKYITNFKKNVVDFRSYLELFEAKINAFHEMVDTCHRNLQEPGKEVEVFLRQYTEFKAKYTSDLEMLKGLNLERKENYYSRYKLSKKVIELEGRMLKLTKGFNYNPPMVSKPPPTAVVKISTKYVGFNSTKKVKADIMSAIKCADTSVIGLYGMGGVGKTTLIQQINNELENVCHSFTYVIMVTVSNSPNIKKLQEEIGGRVGLEFTDQESETMRASKLLERLEKEKCILVILDDLWNALDLSSVGIPSGNGENKCCKIVLTTRNEYVCTQMNARPTIQMACLDPHESWELFERNSGVVESESIKAIAKDVCRECAGLPLAISIVASTLRHKKKEYMWTNFLSDMKESNSKELDGIESKVYVVLKPSYDNLENDDQKLCFLFCSLFPEDHEIDLIDMMYYGLGEGFVTCPRGVSSLDRTLMLIDKLKSRGLLLDARRGEMYVKMHDVVREVAIFIAKTDKKFDFYTNFKGLTKWPDRGDSETTKRMSLMGNSIQHVVDHQKFDRKQMKSLLLNDNKNLETIADSFFEEMEDLLVLDMRRTNLMSLPSSIHNLTNLHVLMVSSSSFDKGIYSVNLQHLFSMVNLSILILQNSRRIPELTKEFGELVHLKVLDFTNTEIDIIWPNVLSNLTKLEVLRLRRSFNRWDGCNEDGKSFVSFFELGSLKHLYALEVDVANSQEFLSKSVPDNFLQSFADRDQKNHIFFNINLAIPSINFFGTTRQTVLSLKGKLQFPKWILLLVKETESLSMEKCKSFQQQLMQNSENTEDYDSFKNLREVIIDNCEDVVLLKSYALKFFVNLEELRIYNCKLKRVIEYYSPNSGDDITILPKLVLIRLLSLDELENIFAITVTPAVVSNGSFQQLKTILITQCSRLKFIFPWNVVVCLVQLGRLEIIRCSQLEVIVGKANSDYDQVVCGLQTQVLFPKMRTMTLWQLPNLKSLWQEQSEKRMEMEWPSLEDIIVKDCYKLNRLFWGHHSAPNLKSLDISEECFEKLIWEDDQAATRFKSLLRVSVFSQIVRGLKAKRENVNSTLVIKDKHEARKEKDIGRSSSLAKEFEGERKQSGLFAKKFVNFVHRARQSGVSVEKDKQEAPSGQWHIGETSSIHDVSVDEEEAFFDCEC